MSNAYQQWQQSKPANGSSGSRIYDLWPDPTQRKAQQPRSIYDGGQTYQGIGQYKEERPSEYAWDPSKVSGEAYVRNLKSKGIMAFDGTVGANAELLAERDFDAVKASLQAIQDAGAQTHEGSRAILDMHADGMGGIQQTGRRGFGQGFSERTIDGLGHVGASVPGVVQLPRGLVNNAEAYAAARAKAEAERGQVPQRTDIGSLRSTGSGLR